MPPGGRNCEVQGFDNTTGQLYVVGTAGCDQIFAPAAKTVEPPADGDARMRAIQKTFQRKSAVKN
jgi:hypothetical protein